MEINLEKCDVLELPSPDWLPAGSSKANTLYRPGDGTVRLRMLFAHINPTLWAFPTWYLFLWCLTRSLLLCPFSHPIVVLKFRLCCCWRRGKFCRDIHSALFEEPDLHFIYEDLRPQSFAFLLINDKTPRIQSTPCFWVSAVLITSITRRQQATFAFLIRLYHDFCRFFGKIDQS